MALLNMLAAATCVLLLSTVAFARGKKEPTTETTLDAIRSIRDQIKETAISVQVSRVNRQISDFRSALVDYEKRTKSFAENVRSGYTLVNTNASGFLAELKGYIVQLPKNETKIVKKKYRSLCYCEGHTRMPCPDRCIDSCYAYSKSGSDASARHSHYYVTTPAYAWRSYDNCTQHRAMHTVQECRCYDGSSISCDSGIHHCYEEKQEMVADGNTCLEFVADQSMLEESFVRFSYLLLEPLNIRLRYLEFQVSSFKQAVIATDLISNITSHMCEEDPDCFPEAAELLWKKLEFYKQRMKNITLEMIKTQEQAEAASKSIHVLKEQTFSQINQSIRKYTCCLKGFNFTVQDNDCNPKLTEIASTSESHEEESS